MKRMRSTLILYNKIPVIPYFNINLSLRIISPPVLHVWCPLLYSASYVPGMYVYPRGGSRFLARRFLAGTRAAVEV